MTLLLLHPVEDATRASAMLADLRKPVHRGGDGTGHGATTTTSDPR